MIDENWRYLSVASGSVLQKTVVNARDVGAGGEPLVRVDHPLVAVEDRASLHQRGIGAGHLGLGEADRGNDVAGHQRLEVALALLVAGVAVAA